MKERIQRAILEHIRTYRMTLPEAVANLCGCSSETAGELLEELCRQGFAGKSDLTPGRPYYFLTSRAAAPLRRGEVANGPVNGTKKVTAYAMLAFCCMQEIYRPLIDSETFRNRFPGLFRAGPHIRYYTLGERLGYLRVDTSENTKGNVHRLISYCERDVRKRCYPRNKPKVEAFLQLVESNRFIVTVLTAFPQKAKRVREELQRMDEWYDQFQMKERGEYVGPDTYDKFKTYKQKHDGKTPRLPPPMEVRVVPGLFELMYPKPLPVAS